MSQSEYILVSEEDSESDSTSHTDEDMSKLLVGL